LGKDFNLHHSLRFGTLPSVYTEENPQSFLESYVNTYLREEVQQEGLTRNLGAFSRFLEAASFSQAAPLNVSLVSTDCGVERKTVENYFHILEDLLLATRIPAFTRRAKRRIQVHPKFFFFDAGVYRALRPKGPLDSTEELDGAALETLVFQELRAINHYWGLGYQIFYWRTPTFLEVDFVLYGERGIKAFEVKRTSRVREKDLQGLREFIKDYPMAKGFLLYGGDRSYFEDQIQVMPLVTFFEEVKTVI
jgi:predicted AAA+ superfamily ATPase